MDVVGPVPRRLPIFNTDRPSPGALLSPQSNERLERGISNGSSRRRDSLARSAPRLAGARPPSSPNAPSALALTDTRSSTVDSVQFGSNSR